MKRSDVIEWGGVALSKIGACISKLRGRRAEGFNSTVRISPKRVDRVDSHTKLVYKN